MKTEKDGALATVVRIPRLDPTLYVGRTATLHGAAALADALLKRRPVVTSALEAKRLEALQSERVLAYAVLERPAEVSMASVVPARNGLLVALTTVASMLDTLRRSRASKLAAKAAAVRAEVLPDGIELVKLPPPELWTVANVVKGKLAATPGLRKRLEAMVPAEAVAEVLAAHDVLGAALDQVRDRARAAMPEVDARELIARLNQRIDWYALAVLAGTEPGDAASVQRAIAALEPIANARALRARRRARKGAQAEDGDEPDAVEAPAVTPAVASAAPLTPPATGDG